MLFLDRKLQFFCVFLYINQNLQPLKKVSYDIIVADFSIHSIRDAVCFCIEVGFQLLGDKYFLQRRKCPRDLTGAISSAEILIPQNDITAKNKNAQTSYFIPNY